MRKKCNLIFVIGILLSVQNFLLFHSSEYGFGKHEHNGKVCDICLSVHHDKLLGDNLAKLLIPNLLSFKISFSKEIPSFFARFQYFNSRAPPLLS